MQFEWDDVKDAINQEKHDVSFYESQFAFYDENRVISKDVSHSNSEEIRYFCFGLVNQKVLTVRFTIRNNKIRIFGAGYWRKGEKKYYDKAQ